MSKLLKNTSLYTIGNILPKAGQFLLLPLYTRFLTPEDYGIVQSMTVLSTILTFFLTMAIERSVYRLYFDYSTDKRKKDFLGSIFITLSLNATVVLIVVLISKSLVSKIFSSIPFFPFYLYAILTVYLTVFGFVPKVYFQVEQKAGKFITISLSDFFLSSVFIIFFIVFQEKGAEGMLLGKLVKSIVLLPVFIMIIKKIINFRFKLEIMKESLKFSLPMVPTLLSAWVMNFSDRIFIERYCTLRELGIYSLAYKLSEALLIFSDGFNKAYDPLFYKTANQNDQIEAKKNLFKYNKIYTLILILGTLFISLFARELIQLLDPKYFSAYKLIPVITMGILFSQVSGLFNKSIYQEKKSKQIMFIGISSALLNIGLNFLLISRYGAFGAAWATTITFIFFFFIKYLYSRKCYFIPIDWKETVPFFIFYLFLITVFSFLDLKLILSIIIKTLFIGIITIVLFFRYKKLFLRLITFKTG
ncbi:MAG: oligosaccharide flippase family protein [Promethearchaeota archaeon]